MMPNTINIKQQVKSMVRLMDNYWLEVPAGGSFLTGVDRRQRIPNIASFPLTATGPAPWRALQSALKVFFFNAVDTAN